MPLLRIIDSHIHLWPSTATQPNHHGWMMPGHQLAKRYGIEDYLKVVDLKLNGFVYVETDRYLPSPGPQIDEGDDEKAKSSKICKWAQEPLEEMKFLRRIVEGKPEPGDGFGSGQGELMKGCVIWAPCHLHPALFQNYLSLVQDTAGPVLWKRVVGFRYLLQAKAEGEMKRLVESEAWLENVMYMSHGRGGKGWTFDIGIDSHRDGVERIEEVVGMIEEIRRREEAGGRSQSKVRFVLNHLNKPALSRIPATALLLRHRTALSRLSSDKNTFIKLSGAFNEFSNNHPTPNTTTAVMSALLPWLEIALAVFPCRILFGSDWPVCNVGGPMGEEGNWKFWLKIVEESLQKLGEEESEWVWWKAAVDAYTLELCEEKMLMG